jgi:hypothetical protein
MQTCADAKALNDNTCKLLCACVAQSAPGPACFDPCLKCAAAAATCGAGAPLPAVCAQYAANPVVKSCISRGRRRMSAL